MSKKSAPTDESRFTHSPMALARELGVAYQTVRNYMSKGWLAPAILPNTSGRYLLDPVLAKKLLEQHKTRDSTLLRQVKQAQAARKYLETGKTPGPDSALSRLPVDGDDDEAIVPEGFVVDGMTIPAVMQSKAKREYYLAERAKLEHEEALGKVVNLEEAADFTLRAYRDFRDSVLNIPSKTAPILAGMDNVDEIEAFLLAFIRTSLQDLAQALNRKFNIE